MMSSPHDKLVRYAFGRNPGRAVSLLKYELSEALSRDIDWSTLRLEPASTIDESLKERLSDLLFSVQRRQGDQVFLRLILLEHQSTIDRLMAFRIYRYVGRFWDRFLEENPTAKNLPAVVPIVLYHGHKAWDAPTDVRELIDAPLEATDTCLPRLQFILDDLSRATDAELEARALDVFAELVLRALARIRESPDAWGEVERWLPLLKRLVQAESGIEALIALFEYTNAVADYEPRAVESLVKQLGNAAAEEAIMTTAADRWEQQGLEKGLKRGRVEGRNEGRIEGRIEGRAETLLKQLRLKFSELSPEIEEKVEKGSEGDFELWTKRVLFADTLNEVFDL